MKELRSVILVELLLPIVLLIFGAYHGVVQTLYRAGVIQDTAFLGIGYYQGLTAHGVINAIVLSVPFRYQAAQPPATAPKQITRTATKEEKTP